MTRGSAYKRMHARNARDAGEREKKEIRKKEIREKEIRKKEKRKKERSQQLPEYRGRQVCMPEKRGQ